MRRPEVPCAVETTLRRGAVRWAGTVHHHRRAVSPPAIVVCSALAKLAERPCCARTSQRCNSPWLPVWAHARVLPSRGPCGAGTRGGLRHACGPLRGSCGRPDKPQPACAAVLRAHGCAPRLWLSVLSPVFGSTEARSRTRGFMFVLTTSRPQTRHVAPTRHCGGGRAAAEPQGLQASRACTGARASAVALVRCRWEGLWEGHILT